VAVTDLKALIREIPDFPKPGIGFKDITTVLKDGDAFRRTVQAMAEPFRNAGVEAVVGVESRGFILGAPIAYELGCGFVLVRKPGKLPSETISTSYQLEYGTDTLEIHTDAVQPGQKVLLVDDLLATGGTISAAAELVRRLSGEIVGFSFFVELAFLKGRERLQGYRVHSLVTYDSE